MQYLVYVARKRNSSSEVYNFKQYECIYLILRGLGLLIWLRLVY